jgi:nitrous oxidase accessory protein NosD
VYGDVDGDGEFQSPGDEPAQIDEGCHCLVDVDKPLSIVSEAGAGGTILRGAVDGMYAVVIDAPNVTLGKKKAGFAIVGDLQHDGLGVRVNATATGARVEGNLLSRLEKGMFVAGDGSRVVGNRIAEVFSQGIHAEGSGITIAANVVEQVGTPGANDSAIHVVGRGAAGHLIERNLVVGNLGIGIYVDDGAGNSAASPHAVVDNLVVGNRAAGIKVVLARTSGGVRVTGNSLYQNDGETGRNCGLDTLSAGPAIDASNNFWGSPGGPGPDPKDDVCSAGTPPDVSAAAAAPFARVAPPMR